jgi:hypothetical protein
MSKIDHEVYDKYFKPFEEFTEKEKQAWLQTLDNACKMFEIKGFKPDVLGYELFLYCWNDDLTEAYHVNISPAEITSQANEYLKYHA